MRRIAREELEVALPGVGGTLRLPGLSRSVDIYRDQWGIPHIRAEEEADLFFAQGLATAQDRLWQMDMDRHQALGRWAEFAGPPGVERDRLLRRAGMGRTARLDYAAASPEARAMVAAYTAGVNAFLATTSSLPIEYAILGQAPEPWEEWHCLAVYKMRNSLLGTFEPKLFRTRLLKRLGPGRIADLIRGYPAGHLLTVPPGAVYQGPDLGGLEELSAASRWLEEVDLGSNAWAISGRRTRSGLPLLAGDSHRRLDVPSVYYQVHLACPGFAVIGYAVPGMPGALHFCHNEHVGWGMTYGGADTQDLFIERFRPGSGGGEYAFKGAWLPAQVLEERIAVRDADPVDVAVVITHHGPVIAGDPATGSGVAISDPGLMAATPWLDAVRDAMRARTVAEFQEGLRCWTDRVNNYAVADVHGNFGYVHAGLIPIRGQVNGWTAVPGWTGEYEWQGYITCDELPRAINPQEGYVVTCNQRVAGPDYPYYVGLYFSPDYRARMIRRRLLELDLGAATAEDMARIHAERYSLPAVGFTRALLDMAPPGPEAARALALLEEWDGRMDRDLAAPSIYAHTRACLTRRLVERLLGGLAGEVLAGAAGTEAHVRLLMLETNLALDQGSRALLPPGQDWPQVLAAAFQQAVSELREELGEDVAQWQWGRLHRTRPQHPLSQVFPELAEVLDPPVLPVHGDGDTPLAGSYELAGGFRATGISVNRYIWDLADWHRSRWIAPLGASGHPGSAHYTDQARAWADVEYIPALWDWGHIAAAAESHQRLEPAGEVRRP